MQWREMAPAQKADAVKAAIRAGARSASQIARHISGVPRNAVVGVCRRMDIHLPNARNRSPYGPHADIVEARLRGRRMRIDKLVGTEAGCIVLRDKAKRPHGENFQAVNAVRLVQRREAAPGLPEVEDKTGNPVGRPAILLNGVGVLFLERDMARQCAWLLPGAGAEPVERKRVCGHPVVSGTSYCPHHAAVSAGRGTPSERRASQGALE